MNNLKYLSFGLMIISVCFILVQFVPVSRDNPAGHEPPRVPEEVVKVLERSCYDCHSHQTVWPWYSRIAPVSWLVAHDVHEGREHLNFSKWQGLDPKKQSRLRDELADEVEGGDMPPAMYLIMHADARLSSGDKKLLVTWGREKSDDDDRDRGGRKRPKVEDKDEHEEDD